MKTPRDLADAIRGRNTGQLIRQTLRLPPRRGPQARQATVRRVPERDLSDRDRIRQEARGGGQVEFTFKRLENPIDPD